VIPTRGITGRGFRRRRRSGLCSVAMLRAVLFDGDAY